MNYCPLACELNRCAGRRKLIGFRATYGAVEVGTFDTHAEAEQALDRFVYDELTRVAA